MITNREPTRRLPAAALSAFLTSMILAAVTLTTFSPAAAAAEVPERASYGRLGHDYGRFGHDAVPTRRRLTVEAGGPIAVEIRDAISTRYSRPGDPFRARLAGDLLADNGRVAIRDGARVIGSVLEVRRSERIGGRASILVSLDRVELPDGSWAPLEASWSSSGRSRTARDAATIGGATVGGAILGRILGRDGGAAVGGLIGAAAGTTIARQRVGEPLVLGSGAILRMHLRAPIAVRARN